jgi:hypothetical protein
MEFELKPVTPIFFGQTKIILKYIENFSSYCAVNTHLVIKNQSVIAVLGKIKLLVHNPYKIDINAICGQNIKFLMT